MRKEEKKGKRRIGLPAVVALALFVCVTLSATTIAGATVVKVVPADQTVTAGQSFSVNVVVEGVTNMAMADADLNFDSGVMQVPLVGGIVEGSWLKNLAGGGGTVAVENIDNTNGIVTFSYSLINPGVGATGSGVLATINFDTKLAATPGKYNLNLTNVLLTDGSGEDIAVDTISNGTVTINPAPVPGLSGTGMVVAIGVLAIVLAISSVGRKRRK